MSVTPVDGLTPIETSYLAERIHQIGFPDRQRKQNAKVFLKELQSVDRVRRLIALHAFFLLSGIEPVGENHWLEIHTKRVFILRTKEE